MQKMYAVNRTDKANLASLRNACRFAAALLLVFVALMALPAFAERPDIVWMAGGHSNYVYSVAFSPDGSMIASGSFDNTVKLWRVSDGVLIRTLVGTAGVRSVAFSPDGSRIAAGVGKGVTLWSISGGLIFQTPEGEHTSDVSSVAFSPDGSMIASGGGEGTIRLWRAADGALLRTLGGHSSVGSVVFSPDGSMIVSGGGEGTIKLWRVSDGKLLRTLEGHTGGVSSVAFSPDGSMIASGGGNTIKLWRASDGALLRTLQGHTSWVLSVAFSPDGSMIASGSGDTTIKLWRVSDGALLGTLWVYDGVRCVAFSPDSSMIVTVGGDFSINLELWSVPYGALIRKLKNHTVLVNSVAFSPDGSMIASGGGDDPYIGKFDKTIKLWRVSDGKLLRTLEGHELYVSSVAFSPDGSMIASGGGEWYSNSIRLWRASDGALLRRLEEHTDRVNSVAFSPDGSIIASGSNDMTVKLWRASDGALLRTLKGYTWHVLSVAFSPDGSMIASGSDDRTIKLWRVSDGALLRTLKGHTDWVNSVAFSPDGSMIASGSNDMTVKLWRTSDGALLRTLDVHPGHVTSVAFSPDGSIIASGSDDNTVRLWRVSDGALLKTYDEETGGGVRSVAFSRDGRLIAWGRGDATVVVARNPFAVGAPPKPPQPSVRVYGPQFAPPAGPVNYQRWYLIGQVHAHWMDDIPTDAIPINLTPEKLAERYRNVGYSFLAPTEHHPSENWKGTANGMFTDFGEASGIIGDSLEDTADRSHVLAIGIGYNSSTMEEVKGLTWEGHKDESKKNQLNRYQNAREAGAVCIVAHPNAKIPLVSNYTWDFLELMSWPNLYDAVEVYNGASSKWGPERYARAFDKWDMLLNSTVSLFATCGDDYTPATTIQTEIDRACVTAVVDLPVGTSPTRKDVLSALKSGCFFASYGKNASMAPRITNWWHDTADGEVKVTVASPEGVKVRFVSNLGPKKWQDFPKDGPASYKCLPKEFWVRAEVTDSKGRVSFTQPIWFRNVKHTAKTFPPPSGSSLKQEGTPVEFELGDALLLFPTRPSGFEEVSGDIMGMDERPRKCPPLGYMSECYRFLPDDKELPKGTTLTISYEPPRVGLCPEGQIAVYWYDTSRGEWTRLQSAVDTEAKTVRAEVTRLGLFALSGEIFGEDVTPPSLAIVSPASGALVSGPVTVSVQAGDDNGVASVNFVLDDEPIGYDLIGADGWTIEIDPSEYAAGKHTLLVIAEDASGNRSETSIELIFGTPGSVAHRGDINGDGKVTISDATIALRIAVGLEKASDYQMKSGDLNGNGKIDVSDVTKILRAAVGIEVL